MTKKQYAKTNTNAYGYRASSHGRYHSKQLPKTKRKHYNLFSIVGILVVMALLFSGLKISRFFIIFALEIVVGLAVCVVLVLQSGKNSSAKSKTRISMKKKMDLPAYHEHNPYPHGLKKKQKELVELRKRNFDWTDDDVQRSSNQCGTFDMQRRSNIRETSEEDLNNIPAYAKEGFVPYRSPFEPINKPVHKTLDLKKVQIEETSLPETDILEDARRIDMTELPVEDSIDSVDDIIVTDESLEQEIEESVIMEAAPVPMKVQEKFVTQQESSVFNSEPESGKQFENVVQIIRNTNEEFVRPPLFLLRNNLDNEEKEEVAVEEDASAQKLIDTLASFGVGARMIHVSRGPSVTRYELQPNAGVKVSKIVNLSDDIALNLAAKDVRIEAPIPGKAAVGIEVPNDEVVPVFLREVIESEEFRRHPSKLAFALGKDIAGNNIVADIGRMPHLLIAGATGSGKSVCINTLITSLLYKASPDEVRLLMVDPKVVELGIYNGIPHLLIPVVTDPKKAAGALNWAVQEMTSRYQLFADNNVRDIKSYNLFIRENGGNATLPQIVIIIDELADLMMAAPNDVEGAICRLAQMARAAGMHLVIATQRPSVDVITGVIKANIPSRISFAVSSQIDSRTILDMGGAEKLVGKGDMLFYPMGEPKPVRVQGAFVSDKEVDAVVSRLKKNNDVQYDEDIIEKIENQGTSSVADTDDEDELLPQAIELVIEYGQASTSLLQRKFKLGYSRAGRIIDQMETRGIISGFEGSKPRQVLISKAEWQEMNA